MMGMKLEIEKRLLLEASKYFGYYDNEPSLVGFEWWNHSLTKFTPLPVDLQIEILNHFPIYEADKLVREAYHHFIVRRRISLPRRFKRWLSSFCSPKNLRIIGARRSQPYSRYLPPDTDRSLSEFGDEAESRCRSFSGWEWELSTCTQSRDHGGFSLYSFPGPHVATLQ